MVNLLQITIKAKYQRDTSARLIKFGLTESTILKRSISPVFHQVKTLRFYNLESHNIQIIITKVKMILCFIQYAPPCILDSVNRWSLTRQLHSRGTLPLWKKPVVPNGMEDEWVPEPVRMLWVRKNLLPLPRLEFQLLNCPTYIALFILVSYIYAKAENSLPVFAFASFSLPHY